MNTQKIQYTESDMPLNMRHIWIVAVASLGQLVGTAVATVAGVIIPLINIMSHPELSSLMQGLIGAADLLGIMIGSVIIGNLSDRYGYLLFFRLCPLLIVAASVVSVLVPDVGVLVVCLFVIGLGIGGEYSLDSDYVSELMPVRWRSVMVGVTKTASALGNIIAAGIAFAMVMSEHDAAEWSTLMWIVAGIGAVMFLSRIHFYQSPKWLYDRGRVAEAEEAVRGFLGPEVTLAAVKSSAANGKNRVEATPDDNLSTLGFIKKHFSSVMLSGVPWACEGLGVYGIGVFIPMLVMALGIEHIAPDASAIMHVADSIRTTLWISCIILPGFVIGVWLTSRKCNVSRLQAIGFWACAVSLVVLLLSYQLHWAKWISLLSFMMFELFLNIGPHLVTYLLPPLIYPVEIRGRGTGLAASIGKFGAVVAVFLIPVLLKQGGAVLVLGVSAAVMAVGAIVTQIYAPRVMK